MFGFHIVLLCLGHQQLYHIFLGFPGKVERIHGGVEFLF